MKWNFITWITHLLNSVQSGRLSVLLPISSLVRAIKSGKMQEKEINKRTAADLQRSFYNNCISCTNCKLLNIERNPKVGLCKSLSQTVNLFHDTCQFHERTRHVQPIKNKHIDYLLHETQLLQ